MENFIVLFGVCLFFVLVWLAMRDCTLSLENNTKSHENCTKEYTFCTLSPMQYGIWLLMTGRNKRNKRKNKANERRN